MTANINSLSLALVAAVANGISTSQSLGAAGNLTITGSLATAGVATMDVARRVGITSAGNDSALTWTITGTNRYGRVQSEVLAGTNVGTSQSVNDYLTVSSIYGSAATASTVTAGTTTVGSSALIAIDYFANPASIAAKLSFTGTATATIEVCMDDPGADYGFNGVPPSWSSATNFNAISTNTSGQIGGPLTAARLTVNSGTGTVKMSMVQGFIAGGV